ncbi:hypothetical protein [Moorena sp. SIO3F7]|uniref:hypothetical protein n=1 Tax=Moorena sp. SIO3F7 TaxID=2607839 RepID=UPI0013FF81E9|nr:hypothetical protein [Moorena sp. SIO3F7]NEQ03939.1 hypothetical protein [Moorena sp. SIO3F7]
MPLASCLLPLAFCLLPLAFCLLPFAFLSNTCVDNPDTNALMRLTLAKRPRYANGHATRSLKNDEPSPAYQAFAF